MNRYSVELIIEITVDAADRAEAERIAEGTVLEGYCVMTVDGTHAASIKRPYVGLVHAVSSDDDTEAT